MSDWGERERVYAGGVMVMQELTMILKDWGKREREMGVAVRDLWCFLASSV